MTATAPTSTRQRTTGGALGPVGDPGAQHRRPQRDQRPDDGQAHPAEHVDRDVRHDDASCSGPASPWARVAPDAGADRQQRRGSDVVAHRAAGTGTAATARSRRTSEAPRASATAAHDAGHRRGSAASTRPATPATTSSTPALSTIRRRPPAPPGGRRLGQRSRASAKWVLHTRIEWVTAPSSSRWTISHPDAGRSGATSATTSERDQPGDDHGAGGMCQPARVRHSPARSSASRSARVVAGAQSRRPDRDGRRTAAARRC